MKRVLEHGGMLVALLMVGVCCYWIWIIVSNISLALTDVPAPMLPQSVTSTASSTTRQDPQRNEIFVPMKIRSFPLKQGSVQLRQECSGKILRDRIPYCRGITRMVLRDQQQFDHVLDRVEAWQDSDIPLWQYATQTVPFGDHIVFIYERNGCPIQQSACVQTGLKAMTHRLHISTKTWTSLSAYPTRSYPFWNEQGTHAIVVTQTCGSKRCDEAPLSLYALETDTLTPVTTLQGANESYAMDVTGLKLGYWESVRWISPTEWEAIHISGQGIKQHVGGVLP